MTTAPTNLNVRTLNAHLLAQGAGGYQINRLGDDEFCLIYEGSVWQVVYAERGFAQEVLFESPSEAQACAFHFDHVTRFRHNHLVGKFTVEADAQAFGAQLTQQGIKHEISPIRWSGHDWRYRVVVYGQDVFKVRRRYGNLPLERIPSLPERIHDAIRRLSEFVPDHEYKVNPPLAATAVEHQPDLSLAYGLPIPETYAYFLREVGDGGPFGPVRFLSLREVLELNDPQLYKQPAPDFVHAALTSPTGEIKIPLDAITTGLPGLLQISRAGDDRGAYYLTQAGDFVTLERLGDAVRVSAEPLRREQFYERTLDMIIGGAGQLETYERTQELMGFGFGLADLERSLGEAASLEWKHGIIATILKHSPDNLEQKLAAWQTQHGGCSIRRPGR